MENNTPTVVEWAPGDFCKSSFSGTEMDKCVEVAKKGGFVAVRNSKLPFATGPISVFTDDEWDAFKLGVKNDEF